MSKYIPLPPYLEDLLRMAARAPPGPLLEVTVGHDADCDLLNNRGGCSCRPDVVEGPPPQRSRR